MGEEEVFSFVVPDEFLKALGGVVVCWNYMEGILHLCLVKLLGKSLDDGRSHVVFAHMSYPQRLDVLSALIKEVSLPIDSPLHNYKANLEGPLKKVQELRNALLHQRWGTENGIVFRSDMRARGALKFTLTPVTVAEIEAVSSEMVAIAHQLYTAVTWTPT